MALCGPMRDYGIADALQLIGHQGKTGVLKARDAAQIVTVEIVKGAVARARVERRQRQDLLGTMLVRAHLITEKKLHDALQEQARSKRPLGRILVAKGAVDLARIRAFARLQATETVCQLFLWNTGTYEFEVAEVEIDDTIVPIRCETILMEGFRQADEWPAIRGKIPGYGAQFRVLEDLEKLSFEFTSQESSDEFGLDAAFGAPDADSVQQARRLHAIGPNERLVFSLVRPGHDVQRIIDVAGIGEFETCKALANLIDGGIIAIITAMIGSEASGVPTFGGMEASGRFGFLLPASRQLAMWLAGLVVVLGYGMHAVGVNPTDNLLQRPRVGFVDTSLRAQLSAGQMQRIRDALGVYRADVGQYPAALDDLVHADLLTRADLNYPWRQRYPYRRAGDTYELWRPLE